MVVSEISDISKLEDKIEIYFENNKDILKTAFIHSSYANEHKNCENNERLEFLGDAVLGLVIAEYCYKKFPGSEGELTEKRIYLMTPEASSLQFEKPKIVKQEESAKCKLCGKKLSTGYYVVFKSHTYGPYGSSCIRKIYLDHLL